MTSHVGRLYSMAGALLAFFVLWAVIAAHPWATPAADPRLAALAKRERQLRADAVLVQKVVERRDAAYRVALAKRRDAIAAAKARAAVTSAVSLPQAASPSVRVVNLPPLVITKTS